MTRTQVYFYPELESTQDQAFLLLKEGIKPPFGVQTRHQTKGRGRRGRSWHSDQGGIYLSLALPFSFDISVLPLVVASHLAKKLNTWIQASHLRVEIKWPNDLVVGPKKLGGILVESRVQGCVRHALVVGIGINMRSIGYHDRIGLMDLIRPGSFDDALSIQQIGNEIYDDMTSSLDCELDWTSGFKIFQIHRYRPWIFDGCLWLQETSYKTGEASFFNLDEKHHVVVTKSSEHQFKLWHPFFEDLVSFVFGIDEKNNDYRILTLFNEKLELVAMKRWTEGLMDCQKWIQSLGIQNRILVFTNEVGQAQAEQSAIEWVEIGIGQDVDQLGQRIIDSFYDELVEQVEWVSQSQSFSIGMLQTVFQCFGYKKSV